MSKDVAANTITKMVHIAIETEVKGRVFKIFKIALAMAAVLEISS